MATGDDKSFSKWLDVILAIAGDREQTAEQLSKILGTSTRNAYYVLKALKDYGFVLHHVHGYYNIDAHSPFFQEISRSVNFTHDQAQFLYNVLNGLDRNNAMAGLTKRKLQRFYHLNEYVGATAKLPGYHKNFTLLQQAMRRKCIVILHDYSSSHSGTVTDRTVEPFLFLGDNTDVRAYEISTGMNKTFRISRIGKVEILKSGWFNEEKHKKVFTDMFLFTSEDWHHVKLRFDLMAHNFMQEEYPHSETLMKQEDDTHWIFETDLASYIGITRFILGLYDNIEILEDDGLRKYVAEKIQKMSHK